MAVKVTHFCQQPPQCFDAVGRQFARADFRGHRYQQTTNRSRPAMNGPHRDVCGSSDLIEQRRFGALIAEVIFEPHIEVRQRKHQVTQRAPRFACRWVSIEMLSIHGQYSPASSKVVTDLSH